MPSPYTHCLATNDQKGDVDGITLNWPASAFTKKLNTAVERTHQSRELLKALTEHLIWDACKRLQNTGARIMYVAQLPLHGPFVINGYKSADS